MRQPVFRAFQASSIGQRLDHSAVASGSAGVSAPSGRLHLDQVLDLEPRSPEQPDHVAVGESELDGAVGVRPVEPMHAEVIALQLLARRQVLVGRRQHREVRTAEEHQRAAGAKDPRRLGDPPVGIAPDRGAVLRDREVEAPVAERRPLGVGVDQWEAEPNSSWNIRAVASCLAELSSPTGRAPRRASHDET